MAIFDETRRPKPLIAKPPNAAQSGQEKLDESFQENVTIEMSEITDKHLATDGPEETIPLTEQKKKNKNKKANNRKKND